MKITTSWKEKVFVVLLLAISVVFSIILFGFAGEVWNLPAESAVSSVLLKLFSVLIYLIMGGFCFMIFCLIKYIIEEYGEPKNKEPPENPKH